MMPGLISAESIGRDCRTGRGPGCRFSFGLPGSGSQLKKRNEKLALQRSGFASLEGQFLCVIFSEVIMQKPLVKLLLRYLVNRGLFENQDTFG